MVVPYRHRALEAFQALETGHLVFLVHLVVPTLVDWASVAADLVYSLGLVVVGFAATRCEVCSLSWTVLSSYHLPVEER